MPRTRYPRQGQRLAPLALRELLEAPIPSDFALPEEMTGWRLYDLDARVWSRLDVATCRHLGAEIIKTVAAAIRAPSGIHLRGVGDIPSNTTLDDLRLEVRTFNCLAAAGMRNRLQNLCHMTIGTLLGLQGFGAKSLVDLLVALEEARERPKDGPRPQGIAPASATRRHETARYPRPGQALAPQTLRELLFGQIPHDIPRDGQWKGTRLCDLDESAWAHFPAEAIDRLVELIVSRAGRAGHHRLLRHRLVPAPPPGVRLQDLDLENRTFHCLVREGYARDIRRLGELTLEKLSSFRAFGAKCLVDLLTAIEASAAHYGHLDEEITAAVERLSELPEAAAVTFSDPRLGPLLRPLDAESNTLDEMCRRLRNRKIDPPEPKRFAQRLSDLHTQILDMTKLPLEDECLEICAPGLSPRDRRILVEHFGWDGGEERTLSQLGETHGLSRERIRQICTDVQNHRRGIPAYSPVLDRALAFLAKSLPAPLGQLQAAFDAEKFSACGMRIAAALRAAALFGRPAPLAIVEAGAGRVAVPPEMAACAAAIARAAIRPTFAFGIGSIERFCELAAREACSPVSRELACATLESFAPDCWLDAQRKWFCLSDPAQSGAANVLEKALSVASEISLGDFSNALLRQRRMPADMLPPPRGLAELCRRIPGVVALNGHIRATRAIDPKAALANAEYILWSVLAECGGVLGRVELEQRSRQRGVTRSNLNAMLFSSPIIRPFGRAIFGLIGAAPNAALIEATARKLRPAYPSRVLRTFGRREDGVTFLAYRLSRAAISGGVLSIPAVLRPQLANSYQLRGADGRVLGTLASRAGCGWGIGPALRHAKVKEGDHLLILLDTAKGEARLHIGDESLLKDLPVA